MLRRIMATLVIAVPIALSIGLVPMSASADTINNEHTASLLLPDVYVAPPPPEKGAPTPDNPETGVVAFPAGSDDTQVLVNRAAYETFVLNYNELREAGDVIAKMLIASAIINIILAGYIVFTMPRKEQLK